MPSIVANPLFVTVAGGLIVAFIFAVVMGLANRVGTPSPRRLRTLALAELDLPPAERRLLARALDDARVRRTITTAANTPRAEGEHLRAAIARLAVGAREPTPLRDAAYAADTIQRWLREVWIMAGRFPRYHDTLVAPWRAYFEARASVSAETSTRPEAGGAAAGQPPSTAAAALPQAAGAVKEAPSTFFFPLEYIGGLADACVGRESDLDKLAMDFVSPQYRLIAIEGIGGVGKTTLAARLAASITASHTILWIDCRSLDVTTQRILLEVGHFANEHYGYPWQATVLTDPKLTDSEKINALIELCAAMSDGSLRPKVGDASHPIALFFDDYNLVNDRTLDRLVERVSDARTSAKVVLTIGNRHPLSPGLQAKIDAGDAVMLEGLSVADCQKLLAAHARRFPSLANLDQETLYRVWKRTAEGVPAALQILISLTRSRSLEDILDKLPDYVPQTEAGKRWYDSMFAELTPDEQQLTREIAILRRPTTRTELNSLSELTNTDDVIDALVDRFILRFDGTQFFMHALWAQYGSRLLQTDERERLHARAAAYYRDLAFAPAQRYALIVSRLESCYHFTQAGDLDEAVRVLKPVVDTLRSWGLFQELTDILDEIERNAQRAGTPLDPQLRVEQAATRYARGEREQATDMLSELTQTTTGAVEIDALQKLAWIYIETADRRQAEDLLKRSLELARRERLPMLEAEALHGLQHIAYFEGAYASAIAYNDQRLALLEPIKDDPQAAEAIAWTYHSIGNILREQGRYDEALKLYQQDLDLWHSRQDPIWNMGWTTYDIGQIYYEQGRWPEARKQFEAALALFERARYLIGIGHVKIELGRTDSWLDGGDASIEEAQEALALLQRVRMTSGVAYATRALGEIRLNLGDPDGALHDLQRGLELEEQLHNLKGVAGSHLFITRAAQRQGERLLATGERAAACASFNRARAAITQAQAFLTQIDAVPNYRGILDDEAAIARACAECDGMSG